MAGLSGPGRHGRPARDSRASPPRGDRRRLDGRSTSLPSRLLRIWLTIATMSLRSSDFAACTSGAIAQKGGKAEQLAERCGIALQLTNILRDVRGGRRNGRVYIPAEDLARFGVAPEELASDGPPSDRLHALLAFEAAARVSILRAGAPARVAGRSGRHGRCS